MNCLVLDPKAKHKIDFNIFNTSNIKGFTLSKGLLVGLSVYSVYNARTLLEYSIHAYVIPSFNKHSVELADIFNNIYRYLLRLGRNFNFKYIFLFMGLMRFWFYPPSFVHSNVGCFLPVRVITEEIDILNKILPVWQYERINEMTNQEKIGARLTALNAADKRISDIFEEVCYYANQTNGNRLEMNRLINDVRRVSGSDAFKRLNRLRSSLLNGIPLDTVLPDGVEKRLNANVRNKYRAE